MTDVNKFQVKETLTSHQSSSGMNIFDSPDFQSRVITSLRFPLIVMIVLFHLYEPGAKVDDTSIVYYSLVKLLGADGIAKIAVPTFFLISGYLFFHNVTNWNINTYWRKLKSRYKTLLRPYLLWNVMPIILIVFLNIVIATQNGFPVFGKAHEFLDSVGWFNIFWNVSDGHPYIVPLWYVRDLMICCLLAPLIEILVNQRWALVYLLTIGLCFLCDFWCDTPGLSIRALFFFSLGAYFSVKKQNIVNSFAKVRLPIYISALLLLITTVFLPQIFGKYHLFACNLFILLGIWSLFNIASFVNAKYRFNTPVFLTESVFFIFAFHTFPLPGVGSVLGGVQRAVGAIPIHNELLSGLIEIIISPVLIVLICVLAFLAISTIAPRLCKVMNGNHIFQWKQT